MVRQNYQRSRQTITSVGKSTIPALPRHNSTDEAAESSRRTKKSKRPSLSSRTPILFNLDDDGRVRKVYDKYVGVSEGISKPYIAIIEQY